MILLTIGRLRIALAMAWTARRPRTARGRDEGSSRRERTETGGDGAPLVVLGPGGDYRREIRPNRL